MRIVEARVARWRLHDSVLGLASQAEKIKLPRLLCSCEKEWSAHRATTSLLQRNTLYHQQFLDSYTELSYPIEIPSSTTFADIRRLVLMSLQNCSIASVPSPLGLALLVHLREGSVLFSNRTGTSFDGGKPRGKD